MTLDAEAWRADAACKDYPVDMWFPERGKNAAHAKLICRTCPVAQPCLDYAIDNHIFTGVFGGLDERGRRAYRRTHRAGHVSVSVAGAPSRDASPGVASRRPDATPSASVGPSRGGSPPAPSPAPHDRGVA